MKTQFEDTSWVHKVSRSQTPPNNRLKLRTHKKSRGGCRNCKVRSVKCDETHPQCKKCLSYGVQCNFVHGVPEMQLAAAGAVYVIEPKYFTLSIDRRDSSPCTEAALLERFQSDVALTVSLGRRLALFQNQVLLLANSFPSLKHTIISLTLMHDRQMKISRNGASSHSNSAPALSEQETGHWYLASSYFKDDLQLALLAAPRGCLNIRQQAALCSTSALLVALTFCYVEATTPDGAWPLRGGRCPSTPEALQWIDLSNGKLSAQALTQDLATHPVFHPLVIFDEQDMSSYPSSHLKMPSFDSECLFQLEQLHCGPEVDSLMMIARSDCLVTIIFAFWSFVGDMTANFKHDLRHKEPIALIILLYWYTKLNPLPLWWLKARTSLEGRAICLYLRRFYGDDVKLMSLLHWPASVLFQPYQGSHPDTWEWLPLIPAY